MVLDRGITELYQRLAMTDRTMIERVAVVIGESLSIQDCELPEAVIYDVARSVLSTIREPTKQMKARGMLAFQAWEDTNDGLVRSAVLAVYSAMIDASIAENA